MGEHFRIEVEPDVVKGVARRLGLLADQLRTRGTKASSAPGRWRSGWQGKAAVAYADEATVLGGHLGTFAGHLDDASGAVQRFGDDLEQAKDTDVPSLNRRWDDTLTTYAAAVAAADAAYQRGVEGIGDDTPPQLGRLVRDELRAASRARASDAAVARDAAQHKLELEYDDLCDRLERHAGRLSSVLASAVAVPVPPALVAAYRMAQGNVLGRVLWDFAGAAVTELATQAEAALDGPIGQLERALDHPPNDVDELRALLDQARAFDVPAPQYRDVLSSYWIGRAAEEAGIDLTEWDPSAGAEANRDIIEAVYEYYGDLYLANPDLQWAGMANMIGPSFAGGFLDLAALRSLGESVGDLPAPLRHALPPGVESLAELTAEDLRFFESTFLSMQREIFFDQGSMHQAYLDGGTEAIREMRDAGLITTETYEGWLDIDSGDPARVQRGNTTFLLREQRDIIDDDYQRMIDHSPTGPAMTWAMTLVGAPSIPGARGYADVFPLHVEFETPGPERLGTPDKVFGVDIPDVSVDNPTQVHVDVTTPLPDGNIANFDDRWALIEQDTLPAFQQLLEQEPDRAREIIGSDVGDRIGDYRMVARVDEIIGQMLDWDVDVDQ